MEEKLSEKELIQVVCQLNSGGVIEVSGTWRSRPRSIFIEQTQWHDTPVCLIGGNGHEVSALHPRDVPFFLDCVLGNYLDSDTFTIKHV